MGVMFADFWSYHKDWCIHLSNLHHSDDMTLNKYWLINKFNDLL